MYISIQIFKYFYVIITFRYNLRICIKGCIFMNSKEVIKSLEEKRQALQLRVLADPTRLRILTRLFEGEESIMTLAKKLGLAPSTIHHHINKLKTVGLIKETRIEHKRNLIERYYRSTWPATAVSEGWQSLKKNEQLEYKLAVLGVLSGWVRDGIEEIRNRELLDLNLSRLYFQTFPDNVELLNELNKILFDAWKKIKKLRGKYENEQTGKTVRVVMTTLLNSEL